MVRLFSFFGEDFGFLVLTLLCSFILLIVLSVIYIVDVFIIFLGGGFFVFCVYFGGIFVVFLYVDGFGVEDGLGFLRFDIVYYNLFLFVLYKFVK